jgi:hypothetical protein
MLVLPAVLVVPAMLVLPEVPKPPAPAVPPAAGDGEAGPLVPLHAIAQGRASAHTANPRANAEGFGLGGGAMMSAPLLMMEDAAIRARAPILVVVTRASH